jgi:hypothetical protein
MVVISSHLSATFFCEEGEAQEEEEEEEEEEEGRK